MRKITEVWDLAYLWQFFHEDEAIPGDYGSQVDDLICILKASSGWRASDLAGTTRDGAGLRRFPDGSYQLRFWSGKVSKGS